jgi:hypothetical protein
MDAAFGGKAPDARREGGGAGAGNVARQWGHCTGTPASTSGERIGRLQDGQRVIMA